MTETTWPTRSEVSTVWLFREEDCRPLIVGSDVMAGNLKSLPLTPGVTPERVSHGVLSGMGGNPPGGPFPSVSPSPSCVIPSPVRVLLHYGCLLILSVLGATHVS